MYDSGRISSACLGLICKCLAATENKICMLWLSTAPDAMEAFIPVVFRMVD